MRSIGIYFPLDFSISLFLLYSFARDSAAADAWRFFVKNEKVRLRLRFTQNDTGEGAVGLRIWGGFLVQNEKSGTGEGAQVQSEKHENHGQSEARQCGDFGTLWA